MFKYLFGTKITVLDQESDDEASSVINEIQTDHEETSVSDPTIDIMDYVLGKPVFSKEVFDGILYEKYLVDHRRVCPNIENWAYNRKVDQDHVNTIYTNLKKMKFPHLIGSLKLVRDKESDSLTLVDGQHRILALTRIMEEDPSISVAIEVDVYHLNDVNKNDIEIQDLFIKANNNKNVTLHDLPETKVMEIIDLLMEKWSKNIKTSDNAYKPNVTKRELYNELKDHMNVTHTLQAKSAKEIVKAIETINTQLRMKSLKELFGREKGISKSKMMQYEKAEKHGFFLNLDCKYNLATWVKQLV